MFEGSLTALVTPFRGRERELDLPSLRELVEWRIAEGSEGVVACGTTGEAATLSAEERDIDVRTVVAGDRSHPRSTGPRPERPTLRINNLAAEEPELGTE